MSEDSARKILRILLKADGHCRNCSATLFRLFVLEFPGFIDIAEEVWAEEWESTFREA